MNNVSTDTEKKEGSFDAQLAVELRALLVPLGLEAGENGSYRGSIGACEVFIETVVGYDELDRVPGCSTPAKLLDLETEHLWRSTYVPPGVSHVPAPNSRILPMFLRRLSDRYAPLGEPRTAAAYAERAVKVILEEIETLLTERTQYIHIYLMDGSAIASGAQDSYEISWWGLSSCRNSRPPTILADTIQTMRRPKRAPLPASKMVLDSLTEAFEMDPKAVEGALLARAPCNELIERDSDFYVGEHEGTRVLTGLGVLNGILRALHGFRVAARYEVKDGREVLQGFCLYPVSGEEAS